MTTLKRLLPSEEIDALLGDIAEEAPRRSRIWYWSQLLAIVVVASWHDTRKHPWLALRAIATGFVALTVCFGVALAVGRVLWLLWPYDPLGVVATNALGFALSGWAIVRFHRVHGIAMAMPFLIMMTLYALVVLAILATDTGPGTRPMPFRQFIAIFGTMFASVPGGILLGGVVGLCQGGRANL